MLSMPMSTVPLDPEALRNANHQALTAQLAIHGHAFTPPCPCSPDRVFVRNGRRVLASEEADSVFAAVADVEVPLMGMAGQNEG